MKHVCFSLDEYESGILDSVEGWNMLWRGSSRVFEALPATRS